MGFFKKPLIAFLTGAAVVPLASTLDSFERIRNFYDNRSTVTLPFVVESMKYGPDLSKENPNYVGDIGRIASKEKVQFDAGCWEFKAKTKIVSPRDAIYYRTDISFRSPDRLINLNNLHAFSVKELVHPISTREFIRLEKGNSMSLTAAQAGDPTGETSVNGEITLIPMPSRMCVTGESCYLNILNCLKKYIPF